jgi:hypothetical protein
MPNNARVTPPNSVTGVNPSADLRLLSPIVPTPVQPMAVGITARAGDWGGTVQVGPNLPRRHVTERLDVPGPSEQLSGTRRAHAAVQAAPAGAAVMDRTGGV